MNQRLNHVQPELRITPGSEPKGSVGGRFSTCDPRLKRPAVKSAEGPECDSQAGQKAGENGDPRDHKSSIAGTIAHISMMSRRRDTEPAKKEETSPTRGAAEDFAAHHESQVFTGTMGSRAHHLGLATRAMALRNLVPHRTLCYRVGPSFGQG